MFFFFFPFLYSKFQTFILLFLISFSFYCSSFHLFILNFNVSFVDYRKAPLHSAQPVSFSFVLGSKVSKESWIAEPYLISFSLQKVFSIYS